MKRVSRKRLFDLENGRGQSSQGGKRHANVAECEEEEEEFAFVMSQDNGTSSLKWFFDLEALKHMTHRKQWFVNFVEDKSRIETVMVADGKVYCVEGRGDVQIKLENGKKCTFSNVLYIPGLNKNLLSINMITKQNPQLEVVFRGEKCFVKYKKGEKVIATGVKEHGLYKLLDENVVQSHALAVDTENSCGSI